MCGCYARSVAGCMTRRRAAAPEATSVPPEPSVTRGARPALRDQGSSDILSTTLGRTISRGGSGAVDASVGGPIRSDGRCDEDARHGSPRGLRAGSAPCVIGEAEEPEGELEVPPDAGMEPIDVFRCILGASLDGEDVDGRAFSGSLRFGDRGRSQPKDMNRVLKYKLLRHLPGGFGHRYERKFEIRTNGFEDAIHRCKGLTCIDLGANLGEYTKKMATGVRQVIAFEPDPWAYAALRENVADFENVRLENAAAGTRDRMVRLCRHPRFEEDPVLYSQSSSIISSKYNVTSESSVEVLQVDFVKYLESLDEDIGIIKIDIEGMEVELLEALFERSDILNRIHHIFAETHESRIPGLKPRARALRRKADRMKRPYVNLYWH